MWPSPWGVDVEDLDDTAFADGTKGGDVKQLTEVVQAVIDVKDGNVFDFRGLNLKGADQIQFDASIFADFADVLAATVDTGNTLTITAGDDALILRVKDVSLLNAGDFTFV